MGPSRFTPAILATLLLAILLGAHQTQGYTNPIENQTNETINADAWNLGAIHLYVGSNTWGNTMIVTNAGIVNNATGYVGYASSAASNTVTVTGAGSIWSNSVILYVGHYGSCNELTITDRGRVVSSNGYVATYSSPTTDNRVTVTGTGSVWKISNKLEMGSQGDNSELIISAGGRVENVNGTIGVHTPAYGNRATVTGPGSVWSNSGTIYVGSSGSCNELIVTNGGLVEAVRGYIGHNSDAVSNTVTVTGPGSVWSNFFNLSVGYGGSSSSLSITDGGRVYNNAGGIGDYSDKNTVTVSGSSSVWSNSQSIGMGATDGGNSLFITNGGHVYCSSAFFGRDGDNNTVMVTGTGSVWNITYSLLVGNRATGNKLSITDGGRVYNSAADIGLAGDYNMVTVIGAGSVWSNSEYLSVGGDYGSGNALVITNGGCVYNGTNPGTGRGGTIGYWEDNNRVMVSGDGTVWSNSAGLSVGDWGSNGNELTITYGGRVYNTSSTIGRFGDSSNNTVTVSGAGSEWNNSDGLFVGGDFTIAGGVHNSVTVTNGAVVSAASVTIYPTNSFNLASEGWLKTMEVNGDLNVYGIFAPGNSTTNSVVNGNLTIAPGGAIEMEIDGDIKGTNHDHLTVTGATTLTGTLDIVLMDGFLPEHGTAFDLFDWGISLNGSFSKVNLPSLFGVEWNTNNLYTTGEISVSGSTADTDGDGILDGWEFMYFGGNISTNGNPDLDPHDNLSEYVAGTNPTNEASYFHVTNETRIATGYVIEWEPSVSNRLYDVNWSTNLMNSFTSLVSGIEFPQNSYTDTIHGAEGTGFYDVDVQMK